MVHEDDDVLDPWWNGAVSGRIIRDFGWSTLKKTSSSGGDSGGKWQFDHFTRATGYAGPAALSVADLRGRTVRVFQHGKGGGKGKGSGEESAVPAADDGGVKDEL